MLSTGARNRMFVPGLLTLLILTLLSGCGMKPSTSKACPRLQTSPLLLTEATQLRKPIEQPNNGFHKETFTLYVIGEYNKLALQVNSLIIEIEEFKKAQEQYQEQ